MPMAHRMETPMPKFRKKPIVIEAIHWDDT